MVRDLRGLGRGGRAAGGSAHGSCPSGRGPAPTPPDQVSGASVVRAVERLAAELERESLARAEDAARRVGVAAAIPLGLCLLPAFMLLGVVPTVASLFGSVTP